MAGASVIISVESCARAAGRFAALALVAVALGACSLFDKDAPVVADEPADKLYNEGLYLLNTKKDAKAAAKKFEEVDRQHPYSDWARKSLIMQAFAYRPSPITRPAPMTTASILPAATSRCIREARMRPTRNS